MAHARALRNRVSALIEAIMKRFQFAAAAFIAIAAPLCAYGAGAVQVLQPWSRPAVAGTNGVGYMVLVNKGRSADILEKVESPIAARVEMHLGSMAGGVMSMKKEDRVSVPAGGQVIFGPGAYHLMFIGLTRTLNAGDQAPATLVFASGAKVPVRFSVSGGSGPPVAGGASH
jgi:copper(I)-binding protein